MNVDAHKRELRDSWKPVRAAGFALRQGYDPRTFTKEDLAEYGEMHESKAHSLLYYI